jgi:hypothetical protein
MSMTALAVKWTAAGPVSAIFWVAENPPRYSAAVLPWSLAQFDFVRAQVILVNISVDPGLVMLSLASVMRWFDVQGGEGSLGKCGTGRGGASWLEGRGEACHERDMGDLGGSLLREPDLTGH